MHITLTSKTTLNDNSYSRKSNFCDFKVYDKYCHKHGTVSFSYFNNMKKEFCQCCLHENGLKANEKIRIESITESITRQLTNLGITHAPDLKSIVANGNTIQQELLKDVRNWVKKPLGNLLLIKPNNTANTQIVLGICRYLICEEKSIIFLRNKDLQIKNSKDLVKVDFLVIDGLDNIDADLLEVLKIRNRLKKSIILTTSLNKEDLEVFFGKRFSNRFFENTKILTYPL